MLIVFFHYPFNKINVSKWDKSGLFIDTLTFLPSRNDEMKHAFDYTKKNQVCMKFIGDLQ